MAFMNLRFKQSQRFTYFKLLYCFVMVAMIEQFCIKSAFAITCSSTVPANSLITRQEDIKDIDNIFLRAYCK